MGLQYLDLPRREGYQTAVRLASVYSFRKKVGRTSGLTVPSFKDDAEKNDYPVRAATRGVSRSQLHD